MVANNMTPVGVLRQVIQEGLVEMRLSDYPLLNLLPKRTHYTDSINWMVDVSTNAATGVAANAAAPAPSSDTVVPATLPIGAQRFSQTIRLSRNDVAQAAAIGTQPLIDLFEAHVDVAMKKIMQAIETNLYVGVGNTASGGITGLDTAIAATGAYAGLNPATAGQEAWSAYVDLNPTSTVVTETLFSEAKTALFNKGQTFTHIFCDGNFLQEYEAAYIAAGKPTTLNTRMAELASMGYTVYEYATRPVIADVYAPANKGYMLDFSNLALYTRKVNDNVSATRNGLHFQIGQLAQDTITTVSYEIACFPQLQLRDRRAGALISNTAP